MLRTRSFPGTVEASKRVELAFQVSGLLVELPVKEGQEVKQGELIGQIRKDEFAARLTALEGQLDQARAELAALRLGERPEERLRRESQVRAAQARMANARAERDRLAPLVPRGAISRTEFELTETQYQVALEELAAAQQMVEKGMIAREEDLLAKERRSRARRSRCRSQHPTQRLHVDGTLRWRDRSAVRRRRAECSSQGPDRAVSRCR